MKRFIIIVFSIILLISGCTSRKIKVETLSFNVYYGDRNNEKIVTETRKLKMGIDENKYMVVMKELIKGPENKRLKMNIHPKTKVLGVEKHNDVAMVNLSKEFTDVNGEIQQMIAMMTVSDTLTQFSEIQSVNIKVEGETYIFQSGFMRDKFNESPIGDNKEMKKISLYFAGPNADQLIRELRSVELAADEKIEERVVKELIKGPTVNGVHKTIPVNTRLIRVDVNNDLASVNLSDSFVKDHWGGSTGELMTIYSIVNSLTDLDHIRRVKFLIDGEEKKVFSHYSLNEIFVRDETLISK